jgi:hypothetical protein
MGYTTSDIRLQEKVREIVPVFKKNWLRGCLRGQGACLACVRPWCKKNGDHVILSNEP